MSDEPKETFWLTKWALTQGIMVVRLADHESSDGMHYASGNHGKFRGFFEHIGIDAHRTREAAEARVQTIISAKLASLDKQRAKLLKMQKSVKYAKETE